MANSSGSSHRCPRPPLRRVLAAVGLGLALGADATAAMPEYLHEALGRFSAEVPPGWAYTQTTVRGVESTTERFDPSRPPAGQWTLVQHNQQPPTAEELEQYLKFKASSAPPLVQAPFQKNDIDPGSFALDREDGEWAVFTCAFRAESSSSDKMLGHLRLVLTVHKQPAWVEKFSLELRAPYSPVLGVKMDELIVHMSFAAPGADRPSLPVQTTSLFSGRIFFVPTAEDLRVSYTRFSRTEAAK